MTKSTIRDEMDKYKPPGVKTFSANYTVIVTNDTDEQITDCFFGVQYNSGGTGGIIAGFQIAPRSTWQHSVAITGCVVETAGSVYFGSERVVFDPGYASPGTCITSTAYRVYYEGNVRLAALVGGMTVAKH